MLSSQQAADDNKEDKLYTVDEALSMIGLGPFQWKILLVTGTLWAADAIEIMILTFLLPTLQEEWNLTDAEVGSIGSAVFAGDLIGALFWSNLSDRIGRRWCIIGSNLGQIIFGMLSAASNEIYFMTFTRLMVGFCLGGSNCSYVLYAEYATQSMRGRLLILQQSFWAVGCTINALIAWFTLELLDWRWYLIISSFPLCLILILAIQIPESVRYLMTVNKVEKAENILNKALIKNNKNLTKNANKEITYG